MFNFVAVSWVWHCQVVYLFQTLWMSCVLGRVTYLCPMLLCALKHAKQALAVNEVEHTGGIVYTVRKENRIDVNVGDCVEVVLLYPYR